MADKEKLDAYLIQLKNGNLDYFDELYYESYQELYYFILSIIKDKSLAEDILQDTYMNILKSISSYQKKTNPFAWMVTIARNNAINMYNRRKKELVQDPHEQVNIFGESYNTPLISGALTQMMIETLDDEELEIVNLRIVYQLTHKEIAKILNRPLGTILWLYNKAIKKLREKVGEENEEV